MIICKYISLKAYAYHLYGFFGEGFQLANFATYNVKTAEHSGLAHRFNLGNGSRRFCLDYDCFVQFIKPFLFLFGLCVQFSGGLAFG